MAQHLLGILILLGSVGGWFALYGLCLLATRPARPQPMPPTQDLGPNPEPPAVVSLLANHWEVTEDAAESTLLDLGARRFLEFRQPADDPVQTTVHVRDPHPAGLNAYEQRIFTRIAGLAVGGVVPLTALTFRDPARAAGFAKRLRAEVIADARQRGLSRRRLPPAVVGALSGAAVLAGAGVALAALVGLRVKTGHDLRGLGAAWLFSTLILGAVGGRNVGERDTAAGRAVAARWLGVAAWLHNTEAFGDLPPSAVAVWDRYLAYGAAVGATRLSSAVIDLGMGNRRRVWSSFGGTWHRVRVSYPRFWPRYGRTAPPMIAKALAAGGIGLLLLYYWTKAVARVAQQSFVSGRPVANLADPVRLAGLTAGLVLVGYGGYVLIRMVIELATPVTITGQVLWMQVWRSTGGGENSPPAPVLHYLAVDDGSSDRTRAWALPSRMAGRCADGDTVTIRVRRWTRRVGEVSIVERGAIRRVEAADATTDRTENLIAAALGIPDQKSGPGRASLPQAPLVTAEEVSRVLGVPVSARPAPGANPLGRMDAFRGPDGGTALMAFVTSGLPGQMAIRSRRRSRPLPGIGDEAYTGDGWAVARRGDTVIMLQLHGQGRSANPTYLYWLLSTAVGRLPAPAAPVG
ncbi:MAG: hypothetical protein V7603_941 [Micromonosporaceae bacterium]